MPRHKEEPTIEQLDGRCGEYEESHPAYGAIQLHRITGLHDSLFGSSVSHQHAMRISIHPAKRIRSSGEDRYYSSLESKIEVELSPNQFAEFISSWGMGSGIPCTIRSVDNKQMPECPSVHQRREIHNELQAKLDGLARQAANLADRLEILAKPGVAVKKSDIQGLISLANKVVMETESNIPFMHRQFNEACDKTATEAKAEVDAAFLHLIGRLGIDKLNEKVAELVGMTEAPKLLAIESEATDEQL